ncbi:thrombospondin type 1 domain-containing protein [Cyclospora cayetanensis]|uniref:Thrombospondin type 1 domain-containing protein n=1 Tax=Cyclospora cayetanensis TaxID=88456 RepID=A0A1D3D089_9EIME|nr:thrombospondin type 1 domain-containing protein [Cyclospora cayetanensis]
MGNVVFDDQMLSISAPEYSRFVENDTIHGLWKFSVLLEPHISTEEAAENLDEAMQNSESNLFNAVAECMATTDVSSFVPLPSIAVSPVARDIISTRGTAQRLWAAYAEAVDSVAVA